jgi:uncharacterized protein YceK
MMREIVIFAALGVALGGCATTGSTTSIAPVCAALVGPITYNSHDKNSDWHAGKKLAPELAVRNRVGVNLHCPKYR